MFIVDSHCHIDFLDYKKNHTNIDDVISKALSKDVKFILSVATTLQHFKKMKQLIRKRDNIVFSCGVHPLNLKTKVDFEYLIQLAKNKKVIALGETGLDYHKGNNSKLQQESFRKHIRIGRQLKKPIIVHSRESSKDTISILHEEKIIDCGGILHSFTEDTKTLTKLLDLGMYISFSGIITFKNAEKIRKTAMNTPLDRILIETDSPYLTPVPYRGKENQPAYTKYIAECLAVIKNVSIEKIAEITTQNFNNLFNLNVNKI
ncbi:Uncharacterized deoxyribonuclease YcfH [Candidatus Providencia siddallii]|uniref:Uncharacterized deoxyribonuclease YcfH n=1 Tax=Candidatus Providencia siddallii TaxID=1715285 RepID=A0A0M6W844_9GAMM|nr:Uncharacterized deoxyribonuclease YcfH [Candidatus Providencia siddallii]